MRERPGFTLIELLILVVVMSIIASVVLVQYVDILADTKVDIARHSLSQLRAHIERYKATHGGQLPSASLIELVTKTNALGQIGTSPQHRYGPYVTEIPPNPLTATSRVEVISNSPPLLSDVAADAGWLYQPGTGELWISHEEHYLE